MTDLLDQRLGNYQLLRLLGQGGFANVYLAEHVYLKSLAAIKVLHTQLGDEEEKYFISEARLLMGLRHPHIIRVLEFGVEKDAPFLVMDYAPNGTLRQRYPKGTRLSPATVVTYVNQIASALQYAHDQKLIHRDVKPENLLFYSNDEILLSDFGIALIAQSSHLQNSEGIIGTATYMSPEQIQGKPTISSDQYSLAVIVYEWLSGLSPFQGSFSEICAQHVFTPPSPLHESVPTILPAIESVVMTALAKEPQQRFASVSAFATALEHACQVDQPDYTTHLLTSSDPLLSSSSAAQQFHTIALDKDSAQSSAVNAIRATRKNVAFVPVEDLSSMAGGNNATVPPGRELMHASDKGSGNIALPVWRNIRQHVLPHRFSPMGFVTLLVILAVFLGVNGYLYYAVFYHPSRAHTIIQASATHQARPSHPIGLRSPATVQPTATPQPVATVQPTPTPVLQANPTQPPATSPPQPTPTPTNQAGGVLALNDPLIAQDTNQWDVLTYAGGTGGCNFTGGAYHATITQTGTFATCMAHATNFVNFTYQVQMTILSGITHDGGGLIFRSSSGSAYRFRVGTDGSFDLVDQVQSLVSSSSPAIKTGLNQTNLLTVVAQGSRISLYVNKQLIATIHDNLSGSGAIGMLAVDFTNPTDVAFSRAQVWQSQ